jgi:hypothetical protein
VIFYVGDAAKATSTIFNDGCHFFPSRKPSLYKRIKSNRLADYIPHAGITVYRGMIARENRPGRAFRLAATRHDRAFFFACPLLAGTPDDRVVPEHGTAGRALTPIRIWPQV